MVTWVNTTKIQLSKPPHSRPTRITGGTHARQNIILSLKIHRDLYQNSIVARRQSAKYSTVIVARQEVPRCSAIHKKGVSISGLHVCAHLFPSFSFSFPLPSINAAQLNVAKFRSSFPSLPSFFSFLLFFFFFLNDHLQNSPLISHRPQPFGWNLAARDFDDFTLRKF